jgi:hypothetical protein
MLDIKFDNGLTTHVREFNLFRQKKKSPFDCFERYRLRMGQIPTSEDNEDYDLCYCIDAAHNIVALSKTRIGFIPKQTQVTAAVDIPIIVTHSRRWEAVKEYLDKLDMDFNREVNKISYKLVKHCKDKNATFVSYDYDPPLLHWTTFSRDRKIEAVVIYEFYLIAYIKG